MKLYYGWIVVGVGLLVQALCWGVGLSAFTFWARPWAADFQAPMGQVMLITMLMQYGMGLMAPFAGRYLDSKSIRLLIIIGILGLSLGLAAAAVGETIWHVMGVYGLLIALGCVLTGPLPFTTLAVKWFNAHRGLALGIATTGPSFGGLIVPPVVAALLQHMSWRDAHLLLAAALPVILIPVVWLLVRNSPKEKGVEPEAEAPVPAGAAPLASMPALSTRDILSSRSFWALNLAFVPALIAFNGVGFNLGPFAADVGISPVQVSLVIAILSAAAIVGCVAFGALADRMDHRLLFAGLVGGIAVSMAIITVAPSFGVMIAIAPVLGFASGGVLPLLSAVCATRFGPASFGAAMGLLGPFITIGAAGAPLAGWGRDHFGSYPMIFTILLLAMLPFTLAILMLKPIAKASAAPPLVPTLEPMPVGLKPPQG